MSNEIDPKKGIIISIPHSGLNWVRYCIEHFSGKRTPGKPKLVKHGDIAVHRTHHILRTRDPDSCNCAFYDHSGNPLHSKMVLILRNAHESYVRNHWQLCDPRNSNTKQTANSIRLGKLGKLSNYFDNITAFDSFRGEKLLVYYQDLVENIQSISEILNFLELPCELKDFEESVHRKRSVAIYHKQHRSYTKKEPTNFRFHRMRTDPEILEALSFAIDFRYSFLAHKYLK